MKDRLIVLDGELNILDIVERTSNKQLIGVSKVLIKSPIYEGII